MKKRLIGKDITGVGLSKDKDMVFFYIKPEEYRDPCFFIFHATADCCSDSWIEDVNVFGFGTCTEIIEYPVEHLPGTKQEEDKKYKITVRTLGGDIDIEFRNSSNGYYGGDLEFFGSVVSAELIKPFDWVTPPGDSVCVLR